MAKKRRRSKQRSERQPLSLTGLSVRGYKSIADDLRLELGHLTVLAGANSSGKSSLVQPLLMLKQTLDVSYDPGVLLIDGANVQLSSADQFLSRVPGLKSPRSFSIGLEHGTDFTVTVRYRQGAQRGFRIEEQNLVNRSLSLTLTPGMKHEQIAKQLPPEFKRLLQIFARSGTKRAKKPASWTVTQERCFLHLALEHPVRKSKLIIRSVIPGLDTHHFEQVIRDLIHVPGLRDMPERTYPMPVAVARSGTFEKYFASVIAYWQSERKTGKLQALNKSLRALGLTWKVEAAPVSDTRVELRVGRLPRSYRGGARDLVSIADVGLGVSQSLPVLVALLAAETGDLVYVEQPEIHLHPSAQFILAGVFIEAVNRGVQVIVETHSALFVLGIQTLVAEGQLEPELVKLHWFHRTPTGHTFVDSTALDDTGAFGDWPVDFGEVFMDAEHRYLRAAEKRLKSVSRGKA